MEYAADPDMVRDARRGDEAAFTSLLRPLLEPAYRLAAGMLQDRQLAEDAVQEAAVKAWRKMHQRREGTEMRPWFFGIVANECRTTRRSRWWSVLKVDAERRSAEAPQDQAARGIDLRNALNRLRPEQRFLSSFSISTWIFRSRRLRPSPKHHLPRCAGDSTAASAN